MGSLGVATLSRLGAGPLTVTNRSTDRAVRLAESYGAGARPMAELADTLATVDVVVAATASPEPVLTREVVAAATADRALGVSHWSCSTSRCRETSAPASPSVPGARR